MKKLINYNSLIVLEIHIQFNQINKFVYIFNNYFCTFIANIIITLNLI